MFEETDERVQQVLLRYVYVDTDQDGVWKNQLLK